MLYQIPDIFREEVSYQQSNGYAVESISENEVVMHKRVRPSGMSIFLNVLLVILFPPIGMMYLLSPVIVINYFRGDRFRLVLMNVNGELKVHLSAYGNANGGGPS